MTWQVVAPPDHPFAAQLQAASREQVAGRGVVVCLPCQIDERASAGVADASASQIATSKCRAERRAFVLVQAWPQQVGGGWARTLHLEMPQVTTCVVNARTSASQAVEWIVAEAAAADGYVEAHYDRRRQSPRACASMLPAPRAGRSAPLGVGRRAARHRRRQRHRRRVRARPGEAIRRAAGAVSGPLARRRTNAQRPAMRIFAACEPPRRVTLSLLSPRRDRCGRRASRR